MHIRVWQQTKDAQTGQNRPKPIKRPWDVTVPSRFNAQIPVPDLLVWLEARRRGELPPIPAQEVS